MRGRVADMLGSSDPLYYAICVDDAPCGIASYLRIDRPAIRSAFEEWLAPENFDEGGVQRRALRTKEE
jgi:hypothetical protein